LDGAILSPTWAHSPKRSVLFLNQMIIDTFVNPTARGF
jgi:hypothetical protein